MVISSKPRAFRARFFPRTSCRDWNDWRWQLQNRITTPARLAQVIRLSGDERPEASGSGVVLPMGITPYYASLLDPDDPVQPLRRSVVATAAEALRSPGEAADPLNEEASSPVPGVVHRYPDRVLVLVTRFCSVFCRYCTRSRMVGHQTATATTQADWQRAVDYVASTPSVKDVLLSGGDPLTLPDEALAWLLDRFGQIAHVKFVRIGTKVPFTLPQRITPRLVRVLRRRRPLWISIHATHPDELTPEAETACARLADAGVPLGSQTVLLKGVNDTPEVLTTLMQRLLTMRVRPYYLYQCDPILGSAHFRTPVARGLELMRTLQGHATGYAVPTYVIDAPGGGGKVRLSPDYCRGRDGDDILLQNFRGQLYRYPDPEQGSAE